MEADLTAARPFLDALGGVFTFQTLPEASGAPPRIFEPLHGSLAEHRSTLMRRNRQGASVLVMANEGDSRGRKKENVTRVRCIFVDLDGSPLEPVNASAIRPSMTVESSPGRFHAYWLVQGMPLHDFTPAQQALAARFNGDTQVCDLPRLMRVPGFLHQKKEVPFQSRLLSCEPELIWDWKTLAEGLDIPHSMSLPMVIPEGQRNALLFKLAQVSNRQGIPKDERIKSLLQVNEQRCLPPLPELEVRGLVERAYREVPDGFLRIPLCLLKAPEFIALGSGEKLLLMLSYLHISGKPTPETPLVWSQFKHHFQRENTFEDYRKRLVKSGLLVKISNGRPPAPGRKPTPAIFRLAHTGAASAPAVT
ncbi:primase C-terminal domain-containing protein [Luteimonas sp. MC1782]|uniref:DNA-primase RepB domain-containing protein n=1 Tax=Luteimonas sp. MC1782 TaxID=2760305 RepID=UPI0015FF0263|nr:DNA-primase RepB domain-containing protein [Luteimonas sp. MC1782]MBB1472600.1 primase C-terminal domain-containing protein [Luteimonas sp. MC1782]